MNGNEELTDLLRTASRAVGDDARTDPGVLISRVRRRRRARGLVAVAAMALVAALAVPALPEREGGTVNVAAGDPGGGGPPSEPSVSPGFFGPVADPTTTVLAGTSTTPAPSAAPTSAPSPSAVPSPPTTARPRTNGAVSTTVPAATPAPTAPPPTLGAPGEPELLSASGTVGRVTLRFDRPVVPGDGPNFDRPTTAPSTDTYMAAMQLVSHMTDSTCSSPNGNAHEYLSGVGTDTITVEATSLVVGTTYISISPGFVKNPVDGTPLKWVRCLGIAIS